MLAGAAIPMPLRVVRGKRLNVFCNVTVIIQVAWLRLKQPDSLAHISIPIAVVR
jgi:hypothetical protein